MVQKPSKIRFDLTQIEQNFKKECLVWGVLVKFIAAYLSIQVHKMF